MQQTASYQQQQHTPGPFDDLGYTIVDRRKSGYGYVVRYGGCAVANCDTLAEASRELIRMVVQRTAAPDLLAALQSLASSYECCISSPSTTREIWREVAEINLRSIRATIAKATA